MLGNDWINDLTFDSNGMLWITHFLGLSCYNPETKEFIKIPVNERLKKYVCYTLLEDKNKQFWIGTNNGIFLYTPHDQNLIHFGKEQGIPSNIICGIQEDRKGNIWCSTYKGLCRISHDGHNITNYFSVRRRECFRSLASTATAYFRKHMTACASYIRRRT